MRRSRLVGFSLVAILLVALLPASSAVAATEPAIWVGDVTVNAPFGRDDYVRVEVPVMLTTAPAEDIFIGWETDPTTADHYYGSGMLTIAAGSTTGQIPVAVRSRRNSGPETVFRVQILWATAGTVVDGVGTVTIRDPSNALAVGDTAVVETDELVAPVPVAVTLPARAKRMTTFTWEVRSATGSVGSDVLADSGTAWIDLGSLGTVVHVRLRGDREVESDETVQLVVTSANGVAIGDGVGVVTIRNDDREPEPTPTATASPTATPSPTDPFGWQPPAGAVPASGTALYIESAPGEFIGEGRTYLYTKANSVLTVSVTGGRVDFSVDGDEFWDGTVAEDRAQLETGYWPSVGRYPSETPGLAFYGNYRDCQRVLGRFSVDEFSYDPAGLATLTLRFEQRCELTGAPLRGFLRYDVSDPTTPPPPGDPSTFPWSPPPGAIPVGDANYLYFQSSTGDYIGQGRTELYTPLDSSLTVTESSGVIALHAVRDPSEWYGHWSGPDAQTQLTVGLYDDLQRYSAHNPVEGGLLFGGEGRFCDTLAGAFAVDGIEYDSQGLFAVRLRFAQHCDETGPPLYGALRWVRPSG